MKGGYVATRDFIYQCRFPKRSLPIPLNNEIVNGTQAERAAADVSSRGIWSTFERTFFDVQVIHP